ncbi:MAG TPA: SWIM zinc finger family protein, partial [Agromyces sp.]
MPSDSFPLVEELAIARLVGPLSLSRGRTVERAGAVHDLVWDASGFRLSASVDGTAAAPYRVDVRLDLGVPGRTTILSGTCTCPVSRNCKHVAAVLLASGERHRLDEAPPAAPAPSDPAEPEWRTALTALTAAPPEADGAPRQPLALQFELRERVTRRGSRQVARDEPATNEEAVERLAVRPVTRGARGGWIKANLTWQNVGFQGRAGGFDPRQARWFAEFSMLKGTRHAGFAEYGSAWISLDDYESATLWALLAAAPSHGIEFVGTGARTEVVVAGAADIGLDVRRSDDGAD